MLDEEVWNAESRDDRDNKRCTEGKLCMTGMNDSREQVAHLFPQTAISGILVPKRRSK